MRSESCELCSLKPGWERDKALFVVVNQSEKLSIRVGLVSHFVNLDPLDVGEDLEDLDHHAETWNDYELEAFFLVIIDQPGGHPHGPEKSLAHIGEHLGGVAFEVEKLGLDLGPAHVLKSVAHNEILRRS